MQAALIKFSGLVFIKAEGGHIGKKGSRRNGKELREEDGVILINIHTKLPKNKIKYQGGGKGII